LLSQSEEGDIPYESIYCNLAEMVGSNIPATNAIKKKTLDVLRMFLHQVKAVTVSFLGNSDLRLEDKETFAAANDELVALELDVHLLCSFLTVGQVTNAQKRVVSIDDDVAAEGGGGGGELPSDGVSRFFNPSQKFRSWTQNLATFIGGSW